MEQRKNILEFRDCSYNNKHLVGGKCSSLGELARLQNKHQFKIADGFAVTTHLYEDFLQTNGLTDLLRKTFQDFTSQDLKLISQISKEITEKISRGHFTDSQEREITEHYQRLSKKYGTTNVAVAIRSSAIAEDLPNASFAGQQDTFLNISGLTGDSGVLSHIKRCMASLFNVRAISYRIRHQIAYQDVKISVAVQKMVRSDLGSAGIAFSLDPETGYDRAIIINSSYGLGELVVSGGVTPDEFICDKPSLGNEGLDPILSTKMGQKTSKIVFNEKQGGIQEMATTEQERSSFSLCERDVVRLARYVAGLETSYQELFGRKLAVDVEWGLDGLDGDLYILQTRPETIHSNQIGQNGQIGQIGQNGQNRNKLLSTYILDQEDGRKILTTGVAVGDKISSGRVKILDSFSQADQFNPGDILVTHMTTPDWEPIMKISSGIITEKGGRTCHSAIVAREMGLNAVVGTGDATQKLKGVDQVTVYCAGGEQGLIYQGSLKYHVERVEVSDKTKLPVKLMMNVGNPEACFGSSLLPHSGVGLVRLEFIISNYLKVHPNALVNYPNLPDNLRHQVADLIGHLDPRTYFIKKLARGVAKIASAYHPHPVIVRFSDFKSNEYRNLLGGEHYEPSEENPMLGWRGASRYYHPDYERSFKLECEMIGYARKYMGMKNIVVMLPFCRTVNEAKLVLDKMSEFGLKRGEDGLQVYLMCEIPSNVIEAKEFSPLVDGVSIGGNDLLQLTLGIDRDNDMLTSIGDHTNVSYRRLISMAIEGYRANGVKVGFCGQQPSDSQEFSRFLVEQGIDSISVTPDSVLRTISRLGDMAQGACRL